MQLESFVQTVKASKVHMKIAQRAFPDGVGVLCRECGATRLLSTEQTAECMVGGWPKCCDQTMQVESLTTR